MDDQPQGLCIRQARLDDRDDILRWRNDPAVRAFSLNTDLVQEDTHRQWYARVLTNPDRVLLIGIDGAHKVGFVRFDRSDGCLWEISIVISSEMRGRKLGKKMLELGMEYVAEHCSPQNFRATVHPSNHASLSLFESLNFRRTSTQGAFITLVRPSIVD